MRIVLVQLPPMPIGPLTLAAIASNMGVSVDLIDFPLRTSEKEFLDDLKGADIVGFSTVCTKYPRTILLAKRIKQMNPRCIIIFGGPQASITYSETLLRYSFVDIILRGEAELGWTTLIGQIQCGALNWNDIPGAAWNDNGNIRETPCTAPEQNLDLLPIPLYERYPRIANSPFSMIEVGRGCPYNCTFCCTNTYFSRQARMKSPERIVKEMNRIHNLYGVSNFDFVHDMFTYNSQTVMSVCSELRKTGYTWGCSSRTDTLTDELLDCMGNSGCKGFYFGIETGSPRMQKVLNKNLDINRAVDTIRTVKRKGFRATVSIIFGFPQETRDDIRDSILMVLEMMNTGVDTIQIPVWSPLSNTPLTNEWKEYDFSTVFSNFSSTDGTATAEEVLLIQSSFNLYSTFYYPLNTYFSRNDYLAVTTALEQLQQYPATRKYLVESEKIKFVNFLLNGGFGDTLLQFDLERIFEQLLKMYSAYNIQSLASEIFNFDKAYNQVSRAPVGSIAQCILNNHSTKTVISSHQIPIGFASQFLFMFIKHEKGVEITAQPIQ